MPRARRHLANGRRQRSAGGLNRGWQIPLVTDAATYCAANDCFAIDEVNTVYDVTFSLVATTAGVTNIQGGDDLYDGMGQGHVAGSVRDCTSEDTVQNAVIDALSHLGVRHLDMPFTSERVWRAINSDR